MGREARLNQKGQHMGSDHKALQFQNKQVPVVGQPFSLKTVSCPINATLNCNCGGPETDVAIVMSVAAACPSCGKVFNAAFNPTQNKLEFLIGTPEEKKPS